MPMEPFNVEFDDIVHSLARQIATQARTIAMLEAQVVTLGRALEPSEAEGEADVPYEEVFVDAIRDGDDIPA